VREGVARGELGERLRDRGDLEGDDLLPLARLLRGGRAVDFVVHEVAHIFHN
jgi:hypothetical protein